MNIEETVKEILEVGKDRITPDEAEFVLQTLRDFLSSHPGYEPKTSRERAAVPNDPEEDQLWSSIQPILDKAQGMDKASQYTHHTPR